MSNKKQVVQNAFLNGLSLLFRIVVGIWLIPYLVKNLGIAAYSFVPVAAILTGYLSIITSSFNAAIARHLVIDLNDESNIKSLETFNTSFFAISGLALIQLPIAAIVILNFDMVFNVPSNIYYDVISLFTLSFFAFITTILSSVFSTSMYAKNRLDLMRLLDICRIAIRVIIVVLFFTLDSPNLLYVGIGEAVASFIVLGISILLWRRLTPQLKVSPRYIRKEKFHEISGMSGWLVLNQIGYLLFLKVDLLVINKFLGAEVSGKYAAVMQWSNIIRTVVAVFSTLSGPLVLAAYAKKEYEKMVHILLFAMKGIGIFVAIISGVLITVSYPLLRVWIGEEIALLYPLLILSVVHLPINLSVVPLFSLNTAFNKVKTPGIVTLLSGLFNVILAVTLIENTNLELYGVAVASLVVLTLKNTIFTPLYAAHSSNMKLTTFIGPLIRTMAATLLVVVVGYLLGGFFDRSSYGSLILLGSLTTLIVFIPIVFISFSKGERNELYSMIPQNVKKHLSWW